MKFNINIPPHHHPPHSFQTTVVEKLTKYIQNAKVKYTVSFVQINNKDRRIKKRLSS